MTRIARWVWVLVLAWMQPGAPLPLAPPRDDTDPVMMTQKPEVFAGKEVVLDDRPQSFRFHQGRGFDEIRLTRTPFTVMLPPELAFQKRPYDPVIRIKGVLSRVGNEWLIRATEARLLPEDVRRLDQAVERLNPADSVLRSQWAQWAETRARIYNDEPLRARARMLEAEAIQLDADRPGADAVALAIRARQRHVPEPLASALAHRGLRAELARAGTAAAARDVLQRVEELLPGSETPPASAVGEAASWRKMYDQDPARTYTVAPPAARRLLDRDLWTDTLIRALTLEMAKPGDTSDLLSRASTAKAQLVDRPDDAKQLLLLGLDSITRDVAELKQGEIERLATSYREELGRAEDGRTLIKRWLDQRRSPRWLSPTDAEGRVILARQYLTLLNDRASAVELLRAAASIDPGAQVVADGFRRLGFRKAGDQWVEGGPSGSPTAPGSDPAKEATATGSLPSPGFGPGAAAGATKGVADLGTLERKTKAEVLAFMGGKPDRVNRSLSQGQVLEQWIYRKPSGGSQYINFIHRAGMAQPLVTGQYTTP